MAQNQVSALIMAGGTGGHIFPGIAVANELSSRGWKISWLGSKNGMEEKIVTAEGIDLSLISISGIRGKGLTGWIKMPFVLGKAVYQAIKIFRLKAPDLVIGFGGFASGPGGIAAFLTGIPLLIHEQNAVAGLTNKMLAKIAKCIFQAFPKAFPDEPLIQRRKIKTVGNPVRKSVLDLHRISKNIVPENINILVIGGSRGAQILNLQLPIAFSKLSMDVQLEITHQVGKGRLEETEKQYRQQFQVIPDGAEKLKKVRLLEFIDDMAQAYHSADIVICRAGASTVSEVSVAGKCALFIPFRLAVDDHQTANAQWLVREQAAYCFSETELQNDTFIQQLEDLICSPELIVKTGKKAKSMAYLNAANEIADYCEQLNDRNIAA